MRKIKRLTSIFLSALIVFSMTAVATESASAIIDSNGCYAPGDNVTCGTYRYYFAMPNNWLNEYSDTAGIYWYNGTDACGAVVGSGSDIRWPGYKPQRENCQYDNYGVYYVDCPTDVPQIIWNNYTDGGEDKEAPIYQTAKQTNDATTEFYVADDSDLYDQDWFDEMEESYSGDKVKLGDFADNFFYDEVYDLGFAFNFDNMIFVPPAEPNGWNFEGRPTYNGDWYFYYGNGEYGTYPTREESESKGTLKNLNAGPDIPDVPVPVDPTEPTSPDEPFVPVYPDDDEGTISFDVKKSGWNLDTNKKIFCHIWKSDGSKTSSGYDWPAWQGKAELCSFDKSTGIATYDLAKTGHNFDVSDGAVYCVIFSSVTGRQTYNTIMSGACIGDTMYCTGVQIENPEDSERKCMVAVWENNPDCGPEKKITSTGNIVGTAYPDGETDETLVARFLICYYEDPAKTDFTQNILNELEVAPSDVFAEVLKLCNDQKAIKQIADILNECTDPTDDTPVLKTNKLTLGLGEKIKIDIYSKADKKFTDFSKYKFYTNNSAVASISSDGTIVAKKTGSTYITIISPKGNVAECTVSVKPAPAKVTINPTSVTLGVGEKYTISESTNSGSYANAANLKWSSSSTSVAAVAKGNTNKAVITAKSVGTANVKITLYNGKTATCKVTVKPAPTSVKTNPASITLGVGESYTISESTNSGSYANAANLAWSSFNNSVATVTKGNSNKAVVTAKGTGTTYILITLFNGKSAICKVTVKPAPASVKTNPTSVTLGKGESYKISEGTNSGSYANAANLKWSSSNTKVATVTKGSANKATIKATGVGTAYVKITLYNGKTAQCKVTVKNAPSSVSLSKTSLTLNKGASYTISECTNSGSYANAANLKWTSSNSNVATVTKGSGNKAVIKANAKGTAYIKITLYNGKTAQCKVTVK